MTQYFKDLIVGYESAPNQATKHAIYSYMVRFKEESDPHAVCYDMGMYVVLYKYATNPVQRKQALDHINAIVDDDYQGEDEIISNFKEFILMKNFLHEDDLEDFDFMCMKMLYFFIDLIEESLRPKKHHVVPLDPMGVLKTNLKEVAEIVKSAGMINLESYKIACKILS